MCAAGTGFTHAKGNRNRPLTVVAREKNRIKSRVRAKVEHVFRVLKCQFGQTKVRYRGREKNANHLFAALALVNLVMAKRRLLQIDGRISSVGVSFSDQEDEE